MLLCSISFSPPPYFSMTFSEHTELTRISKKVSYFLNTFSENIMLVA